MLFQWAPISLPLNFCSPCWFYQQNPQLYPALHCLWTIPLWMPYFISQIPGDLFRQPLFGCGLVSQSCPTLFDSMDCRTSGSSVLHYLLEFAQMYVHWVGDANISSSAAPFSFCLKSFPVSGSFPMSQLFESGGQSIGTSQYVFVLGFCFVFGCTMQHVGS